MPIGLLVVSFLLLCQALVALRAGRITTAGICLGALGYAAITLQRWYRTHGAVSAGQGEREPAAPGGVLVAILYPDEVGRLGRLLAAVEPAAQSMTVLAVDAVGCSAGTVSSATVSSAERFQRECDARPLARLARGAAGAGGPVTVMSAAGRDPALVVLQVALSVRASRVVVLRAMDTSTEEQRHRCTVIWEGLPSPRPALHLEMVATDGDAPPIVIDLAPALAQP